ncbi:DNA ligase 6 isoform X2 [Senna tora]|uniref:DNA ligase 6 isoform X2 n=1 Tax=Senna tora TaxID=362788 RepID=A0A834THH8_9FABA|nr:DNA ligase 6 isoform X2 [Senna tora]
MASKPSPIPKTQTLNSLHLFLTAHQSLHSPPLPPLPSSLPQSKLIPNTRFLIDAFRHAGDYSVSYFLSHFHSDHYTGLTPNWSKGVIFCSNTTSRLLVQVLKVPSKFVVPLRLCDPVEIDGCEITLVDANHCPGAVQFLFKIPGAGGKCERYVHTGDFRFSKAMKSEPLLDAFVGADAVFLDTTYCHPKFQFPTQEESVAYIVDVVGTSGGEYDCSNRDVLFLVATYVVGKEKILLELARRLKRKVHVDTRKMEVLRVLGYGKSGEFTEDDSETNIHVVGWNVLGETWPYFRPNFVKMKEIMTERGYSKVVGFVPTGWTYEVKHNKFTVKSKDSFQIHLVPYSEHSNYDELREYVKFLKPKRVVPTVGVDVEKTDSRHAAKMMKHFAGLVDETANKQEFLRGFHCASGEVGLKFKKDGSDALKPGQNVETKVELSDKQGDRSNNPDIVLNDSSSMREPGPRDPNEEKEKLMQEIRCFLPTWVTQKQVLELISNSGSNVVEAISNFYERETEFHEEVFSCQTSVSASACLSNSDSLSKPPVAPVVTDNTCKSVDIFPSQNSKLSTQRHSVASSVLPAKRKRNSERKINKKVKVDAKSDSSGPKQSTITKFFTKVLPGVTQSGNSGSNSDQSPRVEDSLLSDVEKLYKDEIDQFMQIINGNESLKNYAATTIEKTKGDVTKALDIYYCNSGNLDENEKSVQVECKIDNLSSEKKCVSQELRATPDISVQSVLKETVDATLVSLPPEKYNPSEHACWRGGQPAPYLHLARTFSLLEDEKGKIKATSMLCNMFRSLLALSPMDVLPAVYLCTNKIASAHENKELNIGGSLVTAALEEACGTKRSRIREMYNKFGDLGDVAQECRQSQRLLAPPTPLLIKDVFSALQKIRNLRIGAMIRTVLPALAQAVVMNSCPTLQQDGTAENLKEKLQGLSVAIVEAYNILPTLIWELKVMAQGVCERLWDYQKMVKKKGKVQIVFELDELNITYGILVNIGRVDMGYDGQRAQIHKLDDGSIRVFSRNGDETTSKFPDLIDIIKESWKPAAVTFILDAEIVGIDRKNGYRFMAFQELSSRGRGSKDATVSTDSIKV